MVGRMSCTNCLLLIVIFYSSSVILGSPYTDYQYDDAYNDAYIYDDDNDMFVDDSADSVKDDLPIGDPVIVTPPSNVAVDLGTTIRLQCVVERRNKVMVIWKRGENEIIAMDDKMLVPGRVNRTSVVVTEDSSTLNIALAEESDAGEYTCSLAIPNKTQSVVHRVTVHAPPAIVASSHDSVRAKLGMEVRLHCKGSGSPEPRIVWTRVGGHPLPGGHNELEAEDLVISGVTRKQAGKYRCTVSNGFGTGASKDIDVRVEYTPEIEVEEVFVHTKEGNKVELVCNVHAVPHPTVTWTKNGHRMEHTQERIKQEHHHNRFSLVISPVVKEDFGTYTCHANNHEGADHKTIEISGLAGPTEFKSGRVSKEETAYLLEWTTLSYTNLEQFNLEIRPEGGDWSNKMMVKPHEDGPYHYAGKHYLKELEPATRYEARVSANNAEGWNNPTTFYFATKGAEPRFEGMKGANSGELVRSSLATTILTIAVTLRILFQ